MVDMNVIYSTEKDAANYVQTVFKGVTFSHGREGLREKLLSMLDLDLQNVITTAMSAEDAFAKINEYLKNQSAEILEKIEKSRQNLQRAWNSYGEQSVKFLEFLYQNPFPFKNITAYLTTNNISPYSYTERYFYVRYKPIVAIQLRTAVHELNHFMFYYYYDNLKSTLGEEKYELLKESLTYFSNPEQEGKPNEVALRNFYISRNWINLNEAIDCGVSFLKSQSTA